MACAYSEDSNQIAHPQSDQRIVCPPEDTLVTHRASIDDSDQTAHGLILVFDGSTCHVFFLLDVGALNVLTHYFQKCIFFVFKFELRQDMPP